jgi:hypothetical protein
VEEGKPIPKALVIVLALVVGACAWLVVRDIDDGGGQTAPPLSDVSLVDEVEYGSVAPNAGHTVYWVGPQEGTNVELTKQPEGGVQIRYPDEGLAAGQASIEALTIGSYPMADAEAELDDFAARPDAVVRHSPDGRRVVFSKRRPASVYFASPDNGVEVEVYDPSPQRALSLALSDDVLPLE